LIVGRQLLSCTNRAVFVGPPWRRDDSSKIDATLAPYRRSSLAGVGRTSVVDTTCSIWIRGPIFPSVKQTTFSRVASIQTGSLVASSSPFQYQSKSSASARDSSPDETSTSVGGAEDAAA